MTDPRSDAALTDGGGVAPIVAQGESLWSRRPELILVWIVWAFGPGFWGANLLVGLLTRDDAGGPPDLSALPAFLFGHFVSVVGTFGMLIAKGPQRRLPEFWILVAYWLPFIGFIRAVFASSGSEDERAIGLFARAAVVFIAAIPAAGIIRLLWRWSAAVWRRSGLS